VTSLGTQPSDWRAVDWRSHERVVELDGARLSYVDLGAGEPAVLFIHGLGAQWRVWLANLPAAAEQRRAIAVDLPGFGDSEADGSPVSIRGFAEILERFCERIGLDRVVAVGNSMGGFVAAELAVLAPRLVAGLVLVDAAGIVPTRGELARTLPFLRTSTALGGRLALASRAVAARPRLRKAVLAKILYDGSQIPADFAYYGLLAPPGPSTRAALTASLSALNTEWGEELRQITCPTLIVWGEEDALIPIRHAHEYARLIENAGLVTIPAAGHLPMVEQPERFNAALLEFLGRTP
jgi:pimeloyl-ACP methyl ester carboxylesterase